MALSRKPIALSKELMAHILFPLHRFHCFSNPQVNLLRNRLLVQGLIPLTVSHNPAGLHTPPPDLGAAILLAISFLRTFIIEIWIMILLATPLS
jgi:hypothetical protein